MRLAGLATLASVLLTLASHAGVAASSAYRCETSDAAAAGLHRFSVDPRSGAIVGALPWLTDSWRVVLMSAGSQRSALKLMLRVPGSTPWFLVVDEYQPGPRKPFTVVGDAAVFTGFCE